MTTANETLHDALIRHQIGLLRVSSSVLKRIIALLDATEPDIRAAVDARLGDRTGLATPAQRRRMEALLTQIEDIRSGAWREARTIWAEEMAAVAAAEPDFMAQAVITASPVVVETVSVDARRLRAIATSEPFEGRTLRDWAARIASDDLARIKLAVQRGMVAGEGSAEIARRIVGTVRQRGKDGVTELSRRGAAAITRTAVNHVSNAARAEWIAENADIVDQEHYVATLDSRTTAVCRANDGKIFAIGEGPRPPLHFSCRSLRVPILSPRSLGERPAKAATRRGALRAYAQQAGLARAPATLDTLPRGHKGRFDAFERDFIRARTGRVSATTSYQDWLSRQSPAFQDDVLGKTRGRLFRVGGLRLDRFVNRRGDALTLAELAQREADAFRKAGLNPDTTKRKAA